MHIPESDWKKFRPLRDKALANLCDKVLTAITATTANDALSSHQKYLKIYDEIQHYDEQIGLIFDGYSRSLALSQLAMIQSHHLLEPEEFAGLSASTREYLAQCHL
ncbi:MAG: hypothetical protein KDI34_03345 [Halioglobus sp.]|jgi:hypothetical protein|nr:hypothetical protein [Halioglobus sp.]